MEYMDVYKKWLNADLTPELKEEITQLSEDEIKEIFSAKLKFGTGGVREILGVGPSRLNVFTIRKLAEGLAKYVDAYVGDHQKAAVIAYDNRAYSKEFAAIVASCWPTTTSRSTFSMTCVRRRNCRSRSRSSRPLPE